ncbi:MAG: quinone oxidoreductase [Betaproteobacteria bacterium]|nr:quinone oxidoreductase [Betaproteobacteria bacterium]MBU6512847.1 quinone oxidoreductase [Betaproteobacteria bacterium]MDE1956425.1 quinone oxidoreductase [Betaproteobacteria bacterium]MDE2153741.1 quinone oxidoreductase [Betaproteobacteria bacterium]
MSLARRVVIHEVGDPEVMRIEDSELAAPGAQEVRVRQTAVGFNYIDVYQRQGKYPLPLPSGLGHEAAGVVEAVGAAVSGFAPGDRVAYMNAGIGAYAEARNVAADKLVPVPAGLSDEQAAAVLFKGLTAQYLLRRTHRVQRGQTVLVHAAAGGVGQILCSWAKALGARVLATAGSEAKCELARRAGADLAVDYSQPGWTQRLLEANGGRKAEVVYDSVGRDTFEHSLDCAAPFGLVVLYGAASGPVPPLDTELLNRKGCLYLTRPSVFPHNADPATLRANAAELFDAVARGWVRAEVSARFPLDQVVAMHRAAQSRATHGAVVLIP